MTDNFSEQAREYQEPDEPPRRKPGLSLSVADGIRRGIATGEHPAGSRLPPEPVFAAQLGVSRSTLREALKLLERDGLVTRRQRAGTIVNARPTVQHPLQRNHSVRELIEGSGRRHGVTDAQIRFVEASPEIADALELAPGAPVVVLERTRTADGKPVVRTIDHIDSRIVERATAPLLPDVSFYRWLNDHCRVSVAYGVARVAAMLPPGDLAERLQTPKEEPLFTLVQIDFTAQGTPVLHSEEFHVADAFEVTIIRTGPYND